MVVDPTDPAAGVTGTLTVAVGQYSQAFISLVQMLLHRLVLLLV